MFASARSYFADTVHPVAQVLAKAPSVQMDGPQQRSRNSPRSSVSLVVTRSFTDPERMDLDSLSLVEGKLSMIVSFQVYEGVGVQTQ